MLNYKKVKRLKFKRKLFCKYRERECFDVTDTSLKTHFLMIFYFTTQMKKYKFLESVYFWSINLKQNVLIIKMETKSTLMLTISF